MFLRNKFVVWGASCCFIGCIVMLLIAQQVLFPSFRGQVVSVTTGKSYPVELPLLIKDRGRQVYKLEVVAELKAPYPEKYYVLVDDCLQTISVNGSIINDEQFVFCDHKGRVLDFAPYIASGENIIELTFEDKGEWGALFIAPAISDRIVRTLHILLFAVSFLFVVFLLWVRKASNTAVGVLCIIALWAACWSLFQFEYVHSLRADAGYSYLYQLNALESLTDSIPFFTPEVGSLDTYRPPLRTWLANGVIAMGTFVQRPAQLIVEDLYRLNWFITIFGLCAVYWAAIQFFPKKSDTSRILITMIVGCIPGVGYFAAATSTDAALLFLISVVCIGLLIRWVRGGRVSNLLLAIIATNIAMLTHFVGFALIIPVIGTILFCSKTRVPLAIKKLLMTLALLGINIIWLLYLRNNDSFVINLQNILQFSRSEPRELFPGLLHAISAFWAIDFTSSMEATNILSRSYRYAIFGGFYPSAEFDSFVYFSNLVGKCFLAMVVFGIFTLLRQKGKANLLVVIFALCIPMTVISYTYWFNTIPSYAHVVAVMAFPLAVVIAQGLTAIPAKMKWMGDLLISMFVTTAISMYVLFYLA